MQREGIVFRAKHKTIVLEEFNAFRWKQKRRIALTHAANLLCSAPTFDCNEKACYQIRIRVTK